MNRKFLSPAMIGFITSALMIAVVLFMYVKRDEVNPGLQYIVYVIYALGIIATLLAYRFSDPFNGRFGSLFNQGFRCFIIVTICMVLFTGIFTAMHPEFAEESSQAYRRELLALREKTPEEVEQETARYKKQYTLRLVSVSIFGYLIIGAGVTAASSALLTRRT